MPEPTISEIFGIAGSNAIGTRNFDVIDLAAVQKLIEKSKLEVLDEAKNNAEKQINESKSEVLAEINEAKQDFAKQVQTDKIGLITIFSIFASMIAFLTIEFQFLKNVSNIFCLVGFSFVLYSLLMSFNIGLDYLVKSRHDKDIIKPHVWFNSVLLLLMLIGIGFIWKGSSASLSTECDNLNTIPDQKNKIKNQARQNQIIFIEK